MQYNIHLPYYNETFLYGYGFGIPQSDLEFPNRIWNPSSNEKEAKSIMKPMNNKD